MIVFKLDPKNGVPFYRQIIDQIRFGIASGTLSIGEQLPTVRGLAVELKVNLNTVTKAYKELEIKEVLETHQGTGTFIGSKKFELKENEKKEKLKSICTEVMSIAGSYGFTKKEIIDQINKV